MKRGEVYWCDFGDARKNRPVVIIQNDLGNRHSSEVIVAYITSSPANKVYPTDVAIPDGILPRNGSRVLASRIFTFMKGDIGDRIALLSSDVMREVDVALGVSLALD